MVKLFCAIVGTAGSAFPVDIGTSQSVGDLKDAIAKKKKYLFPADELKVFLAKKDEGRGAWLTEADVKNGVEDTTDLEPLNAARARLRLVGLSDEDVGGVDEEEEAQGRGPVNVLVELPRHLVADSRLLELQESLLHHALMDALSSTSARTNHFKTSLITTYRCGMGDRMLRCMLLNMALPSELVIASHLFRRKNDFLSSNLMGFDDIDDVRNGLLLFQPLEHAFDNLQLSFIYDQPSDVFRLKIFDRLLRRQRLFGKLNPKQRDILLQGKTLPNSWKKRGARNAPGTQFDIQTKFDDVEGLFLRFESVKRPFKRCLTLQARLARNKAIEKEWIRPGEDEFEDFWSEGMSLAEKMAFCSVRQS